MINWDLKARSGNNDDKVKKNRDLRVRSRSVKLHK